MAALSSGLLARTVDGGTRAAVPITAGTPSLLRAINERTVLELIHNRGPLSRAQVADAPEVLVLVLLKSYRHCHGISAVLLLKKERVSKGGLRMVATGQEAVQGLGCQD